VGRIEQLATWVRSIGPFGLFLAAALDSFIPLGHVVDPMVVYLAYTTASPFLYAALAIAGSVLGTTVFFLIVRKGGEAFVVKRISPQRRVQLGARVQRWGVASVIVGGILPPPFPFKGVILLAGLMRMPLLTFVLGLTIARTFRYGLEAALAVRYGDEVLRFMKERYPIVSIAAAALLLAGWLVARRLMREAPCPESS
jgi:membrane protein YqaA with SNARE-associated domain